MNIKDSIAVLILGAVAFFVIVNVTAHSPRATFAVLTVTAIIYLLKRIGEK